MTTAHATEVAGLKEKLDVADDDITLINRRLDEAQGMCFFGLSANIKRSSMLVFIICCDCRWSCRYGDPSGVTCPSQGTSQEE